MAKTKKFQAPEETLAPMDWRPLVGFHDSRTRIQKLISSNNLPSVILLEGREGIGKKIFAAEICAMMWCQTKNGCGTCAECLEIRHHTHEELLWIEDPDQKRLKISDMEQVANHLNYAAALSGAEKQKRRLVVIVDYDLLTIQGSNSLLKTLEEPPAGSSILLTASRPDTLLATILSRVVRIPIRPPSYKEAFDFIKKTSPNSLSDQVIESILRLTGHAIGKSLGMISENKIDGNSYQFLADLIEHHDPASALKTIEQKVRSEKISANDLAQRLEVVLNQYYKYKLGLPNQIKLFSIRPGHGKLDSSRLRHWRLLLRDVKKMALHGQIALNAQLIAESWALGQR